MIEKTSKEYSFDPEKLRQDLKRNKFNSATTVYYLFLKRAERSVNYKKQLQIEFSKKRSPVNVQLEINQQPSIPEGSTQTTAITTTTGQNQSN